jgi:Na+:H+ antiporter, NhaA family
VGELSSERQAMLPVAAAAGGMIVPALVFVAFNAGGPGARGWGIPMATDIAFALGVLALLGPRVPIGIRVFLAALAIVDDIGAVLVIAVFYTGNLAASGLVATGVVLLALVVANRLRLRHTAIYAVLGLVLWLAILGSGIHATIAGVLLAMTIPSRTTINEDEFVERAESALEDFRAACVPDVATVMSNPQQQEALHELERSVEAVQSPLLKFEHALNRPVAFGIMPLFALANAGVRLDAGVIGAISWPVLLGVALGLVVGKFAGISLASWGAVRARVGDLPVGTTWRQIRAVSWLGGIGFTMSLFVADLAFGQGPLLDSA